MILVLNLNASVDRRYMLDTFEKGEVMRARSVENTAGGKGLHVANVLHAGKRFLLDTSGEALRTAFEAKPDFIKPNQAEVADLTGRRAETEEDAQHAICALLDAGLPLACVSLGADGSLLGVAAETPDDPPQLYRVKVPQIDCKNPVGSGDSFVGGFAAALASGKSPQEALRLAAACGTANAMEEESGSVTPETVQALLPKIAITKVS